jgi:hypothetical protein
MGLTPRVFHKLKAKYGKHSSWAIWNHDKPEDTEVIKPNLNCLNISVVLVALNISKRIPTNWQNFHGRDHARKLMYAFNKSPYRGAYMTDLIKEVEVDSGMLWARIKNRPDYVDEQIAKFRHEMDDVGVQKHALFILFGKQAAKIFENRLADVYPNHVRCPHYSRRGTDAQWVDEVWTILEKHSIRPESNARGFTTPEFSRNELMLGRLQQLKEKQNKHRKAGTVR